MATILQTFGANTPLTVAGLATLAAGATVVSDEIDNSGGHLTADIEIVSNNNGSADNTVDVYYMRANDAGEYPSVDVLSNLVYLMSLDILATTPKTNRRIEQLPEYLKIVVKNSNSAQALAGAAIEYQFADLTNA